MTNQKRLLEDIQKVLNIESDTILYVNEKNTTKLGNLSKLQLLRGLPQLGYIGIIKQSENIVNLDWNNEEHSNSFANEVKEATAKQEAERDASASDNKTKGMSIPEK